jgi:cellulose synthase/poly-beta-1,6-N-acetylglucosamine synthase-like glycosyltransferase
MSAARKQLLTGLFECRRVHHRSVSWPKECNSGMFALKLICLLAFALVGYCYAGYPILLMAYAELFGERHSSRTAPRGQTWPAVSLVIAAYKEKDVILERVRNALAMDYPSDRLEIIVGCDGQEDPTGELVRSVRDARLRVIEFPERRGKPSVLNDCVSVAKGEIIAFSDANSHYHPDALKMMVSHFDLPQVGGVVGALNLVDHAGGRNVDGLYWRLENHLKDCESRIGALLGANGAIYSVRRELWRPLTPNTIVDDFVVGMRVHQAGRELVFEPAAVAREETAPSVEAEFHRRVRLGAGGFQSLQWLTPLLHPRYGAVAWAFWSHKVLRWFCPLLLLIGLATDIALLSQPAFQYLLGLQLAGYAAAALGVVLPGRSAATKLCRMATMFVAMNAALLLGLWRCLTGSQSAAWRRTARIAETSDADV